MARPLRIEYPNALYHITARGNERSCIYLSDHDRNQFLGVLAQVVESHNWMCHAYCLMDNHYHLLIETPDGNLSRGMRDLNSIYSQRFNRIHSRDGHLFQGRFKSFIIEKEAYLLEVARYIVLNPVRAKTVKHPKEWRWSSYRATAGYRKPHKSLTVDWILQNFGKHRKQATHEYRKFVADGVKMTNPFEHAVEGNILGFPQFVDFIWNLQPRTDALKEISKNERFVGRPALRDLLDSLKDKAHRDVMMEVACFHCGYTQKEIADFLNLHYSTVSKILNNSRFKT